MILNSMRSGDLSWASLAMSKTMEWNIGPHTVLKVISSRLEIYNPCATSLTSWCKHRTGVDCSAKNRVSENNLADVWINVVTSTWQTKFQRKLVFSRVRFILVIVVTYDVLVHKRATTKLTMFSARFIWFWWFLNPFVCPHDVIQYAPPPPTAPPPHPHPTPLCDPSDPYTLVLCAPLTYIQPNTMTDGGQYNTTTITEHSLLFLHTVSSLITKVMLSTARQHGNACAFPRKIYICLAIQVEYFPQIEYIFHTLVC